MGVHREVQGLRVSGIRAEVCVFLFVLDAGVRFSLLQFLVPGCRNLNP